MPSQQRPQETPREPWDDHSEMFQIGVKNLGLYTSLPTLTRVGVPMRERSLG